ncbi:hypothetical protein GF324_10965 [bacterium]|nr:hypothetical protein [bacterium]
MKRELATTISSALIAALMGITWIGCSQQSEGDNGINPVDDELTISDVSVSTTPFRATVDFTVNYPAVAEIAYGVNAGGVPDSLQDDSLLYDEIAYDTLFYRKDHSVSLTGLSPATQYVYKISALSTDSLTASTSQATFTTPDTTGGEGGPLISNLAIVEIGSNSARVIWDTDIPSDSRAYWSETPADWTDSTFIENLVVNHTLLLDNLESANEYYVQVRSTETNGLSSTSDIISFSTVADDEPPQLIDVEVLYTTSNTAAVAWRTNEPADSRVIYGLAGEERDSLVIANYIREHVIGLTGLSPQTSYEFFVASHDEEGNRTSSSLLGFDTQAEITICGPDTSFARDDTLMFPLRIEGAQDLHALELVINYDPIALRANPALIEEGEFALDNNHMFFESDVDPINGTITLQVTWSITFNGNKPTGTNADGDGTLAFISFTGLTTGATEVNMDTGLSNAYDCLSQAVTIGCEGATITVTAP